MNLVEINNCTHLVFKNDDINKYLSKRQQRKLRKFEEIITNGRQLNGKKRYNEYYICNKDEPYANEVITTILTGELRKGTSVGIL